jgi:hypothetical protein
MIYIYDYKGIKELEVEFTAEKRRKHFSQHEYPEVDIVAIWYNGRDISQAVERLSQIQKASKVVSLYDVLDYDISSKLYDSDEYREAIEEFGDIESL